jgi:hypothetical protein
MSQFVLLWGIHNMGRTALGKEFVFYISDDLKIVFIYGMLKWHEVN